MNGRLQQSSIPQFVSNPLKKHDEGVCGNTNGHNQARHSGKGQAVALDIGEVGDDEVRQDERGAERKHGHETQQAVLEERIDHDQCQTNGSRDQTALQLGQAQCGGNRFGALHLEANRQSTELQLVGKHCRTFLSKRTGNLGVSIGNRRQCPRRRNHPTVEDDGELVLHAGQSDESLGHTAERVCSLSVKVDEHTPLVRRDSGGAWHEAGRGILNRLTAHFDRSQNETVEPIRRTGHERQCRVGDVCAGGIEFEAINRLVLRVKLRSNPRQITGTGGLDPICWIRFWNVCGRVLRLGGSW